jgi:shikimate kinase
MRFGIRKSRKTAHNLAPSPEALDLARRLGPRSIVLVGMMGCGKTSVGRRLARRLDLRFVDSDDEIEAAAGGQKIRDIFKENGEAFFRDRERQVIARLLTEGPCVLATGGGAFMNAQTRDAVATHGVSVWLNAELPVLLDRVMRRSPQDRPILNIDGLTPEQNLSRFMIQRRPFYAQADVTVETRDVSHEVVVDEVLAALMTSPKLSIRAAK